MVQNGNKLSGKLELNWVNKNKTLIVKDLPLNLNRYILRQILEKRTSMNVVDLKAKVMGPYMKATVLFKWKKQSNL